MVKRFRDLTEKYRSFRLQSDPLYDSRLIQTLFNKFIKQGKKASSRHQIRRALSQLRCSLRRPRLYNVILRMLRSLRIQFALVARRQARRIIEVPTPIRRNKRDVMNIQTFTNAVRKRHERNLHHRLTSELLDLTIHHLHSVTLRQRTAQMSKVHDERVNMDKRWK